jgi:hypothetical protein
MILFFLNECLYMDDGVEDRIIANLSTGVCRCCLGGQLGLLLRACRAQSGSKYVGYQAIF